MPMDDEKRAEAFLTFYKQQMQRLDTQGVEWKANFGVWALLAGSIYFAAEHSVPVPRWAAVLMCLSTFVMHVWWLVKIHRSEEIDKELLVRYRKEALLLIRKSGAEMRSHEAEYSPRNRRKEMLWLVPETWLTLVLAMIATQVPSARLHLSERKKTL